MGPNIVALILAAGFSSRMGDFKPLLQFGEQTVIEKAVTAFLQAGISDIRVVVGHRADELLPVLQGLGVTPVYNRQYANGMFTSVKAGVSTLDSGVDGFLMLPGDMPLVKNWTIQRLIEAYQQSENAVIYPVFRGRRGHPPLITRKCFSQILAAEMDGNLRQVMHHFEADTLELTVIDQCIGWDLDTPADYLTALEYARQKDYPTLEECEAIFELSQTPEKVIRHGQTVAHVAQRIAVTLNRTGKCQLDVELITVCGLLHDLARTAPDHAREGARRLSIWGYPGVAKVIAQHMDYQMPSQDAPIDETMIVFIADKLVTGEQIVPLRHRYSAARHKYKGNYEAIQRIERRRQQAEDVRMKLEECLDGKGIYEIAISEEG